MPMHASDIITNIAKQNMNLMASTFSANNMWSTGEKKTKSFGKSK